MATAKSLLKSLSSQLSRLTAHRAGNVATMFAILVVPIVAMVGAAVDYSNAFRAKSRVQQALDATSLAVNRSIGQISESDLAKLAQDTFISNLGPHFSATLSKIDIAIQDRVVTLQANTQVKTMFMGVVGIDTIDIGATSQTVTGKLISEVALVLDNSGSMQGSKINDLRKAAEALTELLFAGQSESDMVKVGVVPFAAAVNVGPQYNTAGWMDTNAVSPIHGENFSAPANRFDLYDNIDQVEWAGCVETRPYPLDVLDTAPTAGTPASYFVPMFAPDEPDGYSNTENNYVSDDPDSKSGWDDSGKGKGGKGKGGKGKGGKGKGGKDDDDDDDGPMTWDEAQMNVDKYYPGVKIQGGGNNGGGPNYNCLSSPITPLSAYKSDITDAFKKMQANGMTNIHQAVMWGWRVLSSQEPFTEGLPTGTENVLKIIVLMTDGANTHRGINSPNMSMYSAYGYARNGRLGPPTKSTSTLVSRMNERTSEACQNAKEDGILVYTVAFGLASDPATRKLLRDCASTAEMAFTPESGSDLIAAFETIGKELSTLRIAK